MAPHKVSHQAADATSAPSDDSAANPASAFTPAQVRGHGRLLIVMGVLVWIWLIFSGWKQWQFSEQATVATGRITSLKPPMVAFHDRAGREVIFTQNLRSKTASIGDEVLVKYLPANPQRAELKEALWSTQWILAIFGAIMLALGWRFQTGGF